MSSTVIYLEAHLRDSRDTLEFNLESVIIIFIYKICSTSRIRLRILLIKTEELGDDALFKVDLSDIDYEIVDQELVLENCNNCIWPIIVIDTRIIAGLCSVARQILISSKCDVARELLGFREACLMACNETSIWTKFCEVDMINAVKTILNDGTHTKSKLVTLPVDATRFEYHLEQPVRAHNVYKIIREKNNGKAMAEELLTVNSLEHSFSEGSSMTLSDAILYISFKVMFDFYGCGVFEKYFPLTTVWFKNLQNIFPDIRFEHVNVSVHKPAEDCEIIFSDAPKKSLYITDPQRYNSRNRIYTKQADVENSIHLINHINVVNQMIPFGEEVAFSWSKIPLEVNPLGGALPKHRAARKCEQLENVVKATMAVVKSRTCTIVDFCSGSGHLGLLLAVLLPNCRIILVENKQKSLDRAMERIVSLNITNVTLLQCNLDYFKAKFDVGVALHSCGVATDLVLQNCIKNRAHFICTPCCYGGIRDCYHLTYPRSEEFKNSSLTYRDYLTLAHCADQTHNDGNVKTKQGYFCMDIIDTDRKLQAVESGYKVHLGKLLPMSCSPKNNLLVGISVI